MNEKEKIELLVKLSHEDKTNMEMYQCFDMKYSTFLKWKARVKRMGFDVAVKGATRGVPQTDIYFNELNYEQGSKQGRLKRDRHLRDNYYTTLEVVERLWNKQNGLCMMCAVKDKLFIKYSSIKGDIKGNVLGLLCANCKEK